MPEDSGNRTGGKCRQPDDKMIETEGRAAPLGRGEIGHDRRHQPLGHAEIDAPQHGRKKALPGGVRHRQHGVSRDERRETGIEDAAPPLSLGVAPIGGPAGAIGGRGIDQIHHDEEGRHQSDTQAKLGAAQQHEGLAEDSELHDACDRQEADKAGAERAEPPERRALGLLGRTMSPRRLAHAEGQQQNAQHGRNDGEPVDRADVIIEQGHEEERQQRPERCPDRIERLAHPEGDAALALGREIGQQRIARRSADALSNAIDEARRHHPGEAGGRRKERLGHRREPVAGERQQLAPTHHVAQPAGEQLGKGGRRLRHP